MSRIARLASRAAPLDAPRHAAYVALCIALCVAPLVGLAPGCRSAPRRPPVFTDADYPGPLRPPSALGLDVLWQQRVTARWGEEGRQRFDAALQARGDVLTLVGLSPMGSTGFVVTLDGLAIDLRNDSDRELPFPPRFLLLDVQRVVFPWLAAAGEARADGTYQGEVEGEAVTERVQGGRLVERRFRRLDGRPAGEIVVTYAWEQPDWAGPSRAVLDNGWFGYRLEIDTLAETRLPPPDAAHGDGAADAAGR